MLTSTASTAVNGAPEPVEAEPATSVEEKPAAPEPEKEEEAPKEAAPAVDKDIEIEDAEPATAPDASAPDAAPETNGASAAKPKRKSSTGIPEHRTKSLKKKQSKAKMTNLDAQPGDYYLARLRSYPPWPAIVCDETMLPAVLLNTRPVTAKQSNGTYKEPYVDGGKKVADRTLPIMFLHTNELYVLQRTSQRAELTHSSGWIPNTDLTPLDPEQCKDVSEKGKAKSLIEAYKVAAEGHDLAHFKEMLRLHVQAMQEDERLREQREAEKAAKAEKKKRKSEVKVDDDVEMEDVEEAPKKPSKKRKKDVESDDDEPEKVCYSCVCDYPRLTSANSLQRLPRQQRSSSIPARLPPPIRRRTRRLLRPSLRKRRRRKSLKTTLSQKRKKSRSILSKLAKFERKRCSSYATNYRKASSHAIKSLPKPRCHKWPATSKNWKPTAVPLRSA